MPNDFNLTHMCLRDDRNGASCGQDSKVALIKESLKREPNLKLYFSPWSAPAWMKTSRQLTNGKIRGLGEGKWTDDDRRVAKAWAQSYVKFADLYAAEGISFWGLTIQNEPHVDQFVTWNSALVTGADELALVDILGPLMRKRYPHLKIMIHDDQVFTLHERLLDSGGNILSSKYVDGVAIHWYGTLAGTYENGSAQHVLEPLPIGPYVVGGGIQVKEIYDKYLSVSGKFMLGTEACNGYVNAVGHALKDPSSPSNNRGVRPGDWYRGYRYSRDIYYQLMNGASGWTDWNLILRADGGPNWAGNNVDAPVLVSPDGDLLWVSPMYFHLAHWSKYVIPGSKVLPVDFSDSELHEIAAFLRPDKRIVIIALSDQLDGHGDPPVNQLIRVIVGGLQIELQMLSSSIVTAVFDAPGQIHSSVQFT
jgi:glucosylceramidase